MDNDGGKGRRCPAVFFVLMLVFCFLAPLFGGCGGAVEEAVEEGKNGVRQPPAAREEEPFRFTDPLTGRQVKRLIPVLAVMIDNLEASRPQTGLGEAGIVYEMEVEGGISRLMALYAGDPPENVGPVRSARTYFLHIAREWDALYAHVGGSADALANIRAWGINDLDEITDGGEFWRDRTRRAPHNVYLEVERVAGRGEVKAAGHWNFGPPPPENPGAHSISFNCTPGNRVTYRFSPQERRYLRFVNGSPCRDRVSGERIAVTNVVIQYAPHYRRGDSLGHIDIAVIGRGRAEFFLAGRHLLGSWEKRSSRSPTRFFDEEGREITFVRGNTWIQVLRPGTRVEVVES